MNKQVAAANAEVLAEVVSATEKHPQFGTPHHGYAVILEELDELWDEVKGWPKRTTLRTMRDEAKQIAATAIRYMAELCPVECQPEVALPTAAISPKDMALAGSRHNVIRSDVDYTVSTKFTCGCVVDHGTSIEARCGEHAQGKPLLRVVKTGARRTSPGADALFKDLMAGRYPGLVVTEFIHGGGEVVIKAFEQQAA